MPETPDVPAAFQAPASIGEEASPVAAFDIEAWRSGKKVPTRVIPVTNDPGAGLRLMQLQDRELEIRTAHATAHAEGRKVPGKRAGSTTTAELESLKDDIRAALDELDGTWTYIHVRALTPREANQVSDVKGRIDQIATALTLGGTLSHTREVPGQALDRDGWDGVLETVGVAQVLKIDQVLTELTQASVTPDFSRRVSALLDGGDSSSN